MPDAPRYLITTSDERTWKFDRPVIFLGEWCRCYDRWSVWSKMDAIVAAPYGLGQAQKDQDCVRTRILQEQLIALLHHELNRFHGADHGLRYWQIVLGHWLKRYVDVVFNRYQTLRQCIESHPLSGTSRLGSDSYHLATQDSSSFVLACNDPVWNSLLCTRIIAFLTDGPRTTASVPIEDGSGFSLSQNHVRVSFGRRMKRMVRRQAELLTNLFVGDDDAFIVNSYLPLVEEAKLQAILGQVPQLWRSPALKQFEPDSELRTSLAQRIVRSPVADIDHCVAALLFELLPTCYLEGFGALGAQAERLPWPARPRFVFTSNNFDTDEIFKCWVAEKAEDGMPYCVGQHGNNYGTYRYANPSFEELIADKFLTWGWTDGLPQHTAAFIFKTVGGKPQSHDPIGALLLVETCLNHRITTWDGYAEFEEYFKEQQTFVAGLESSPRGKLILRLPREYVAHDWSEELRWQAFDPHLKIDNGTRRIGDVIGESRLVVHSYDSTGILEGLSQNVPTLAFWQNGLSHLRDNAKSHYQMLIDAGIVHLTPESASRKVNEIWDDVASWWESSETQAARRKFCDRYARSSARPIRDLKRILTRTRM